MESCFQGMPVKIAFIYILTNKITRNIPSKACEEDAIKEHWWLFKDLIELMFTIFINCILSFFHLQFFFLQLRKNAIKTSEKKLLIFLLIEETLSYKKNHKVLIFKKWWSNYFLRQYLWIIIILPNYFKILMDKKTYNKLLKKTISDFKAS